MGETLEDWLTGQLTEHQKAKEIEAKRFKETKDEKSWIAKEEELRMEAALLWHLTLYAEQNNDALVSRARLRRCAVLEKRANKSNTTKLHEVKIEKSKKKWAAFRESKELGTIESRSSSGESLEPSGSKK